MIKYLKNENMVIYQSKTFYEVVLEIVVKNDNFHVIFLNKSVHKWTLFESHHVCL